VKVRHQFIGSAEASHRAQQVLRRLQLGTAWKGKFFCSCKRTPSRCQRKRREKQCWSLRGFQWKWNGRRGSVILIGQGWKRAITEEDREARLQRKEERETKLEEPRIEVQQAQTSMMMKMIEMMQLKESYFGFVRSYCSTEESEFFVIIQYQVARDSGSALADNNRRISR
jgi:hypothetical protein